MVVNVDKFIDESEAGTLAGGFAVSTVSWSPEVAIDISGPPTLSTLPGSQINTQDHADAVTSGLKFEFTVPENYDSGAIRLQAVYAMSTAVAAPNNIVSLSVGAEIADVVTGAIDTVTYAPALIAVITPDNLTDVARTSNLMSIAEGDIAPGDKIVFKIERLGGGGGDLHTGDWKLIDYMVLYEGQVAPSAAIHQVETFSDTAGSPAVAGTKSSFNTLDFQEGFTQEQKFQWTVPDNWDGVSDFNVRFTYAMAGAGGGTVRLDLSGEAASINTGFVTPTPPAVFLLATFPDTDVHRSTVAYSISGIGRAAGDVVSITISRPSADPLDTHASDWQLIAATVFIGQGGSTAVSTEIDIMYLPPDFAGDFETWAKMGSTVAAGRVNAEWQGKLRTTQTKIKTISIPIKGQNGGPSPEYQVKVYVEGSGAVPVYTGALTAETTGLRSLISISEGDLSAQPTGEKRYFVVVEATLDPGEELRVGTPFVRQE
jgi:hypothetical protein